MIGFCGIDWSATGSMFSGVAAWAGVGAVVWAAKQGRDAVGDWRAQKVIERQLDTGERALTAAYRAKSALESIRANLMTGGEMAKAEEELARDNPFADQPDRARRAKFVQSFYNRVNATKEDWDEVFAVIPLCVAYFGEDVAEALRSLIYQRNSVTVAADEYLDDVDGRDREFTKSLRKEMFRGKAGEDPVAEKVNEAIAKLEAKLLPLLRNDTRSLRAK